MYPASSPSPRHVRRSRATKNSSRQKPPILEQLEHRRLLSITPVLYGTPGTPGHDRAALADLDPATYYESATPQATLGYDFGTPVTIPAIFVTPRQGFADRMVGAQIQASNDGQFWTTLAVIGAAPPDYSTRLDISDPAAYRYYQYVSPDGSYGDLAQLTVAAPSTTPAAPTNVTITDNANGNVSVTWTDNADDEVGYTVDLTPDPYFSYVPYRQASLPAGTTSASFSNVTQDSYYLRVSAGNPGGAGTTVIGPFQVGTPAPLAPAAPADVHASRSSGANSNVSVRWTDLATNENRYRVEVFTNPDFAGSPTYIGELPANASSTSFPTPENSVADYYVRVRAQNDNGVSSYVYANPATSVLPEAPITGLTYTAGPNSLTINWSDVPGNTRSFLAYLVPTYPVGPTRNSTDTKNVPADANTVTFDDLAPGTYDVRISAGSFVGSIVAATSLTRLRGVPIGTSGSFNNEGSDFTKAFDDNPLTYFDAPTPDANFVGYDFGSPATVNQVYYVARPGQESRTNGAQIRGSSDGVHWTTLATLGSSDRYLTSGYRRADIANPAAYRYIQFLSPNDGWGNVAELNFYGVSGPSSSPGAPAAPSDVQSTPTTTGLTFTWTDNATNETSYVAELTQVGVLGPKTITLDLPANSTSATFDGIGSGSYTFTVRAVNAGGSGDTTTSAVFGAQAVIQLVGTPFGAFGSWQNGGDNFHKAFDNDPNTFFDAASSDGNYAAYDFGAPVTVQVVKFYPRASQTSRMVGGTFAVSDDGFHWTTVATITQNPAANVENTLEISPGLAGAHRYFGYFSPPGSFGNVAELRFYGSGTTVAVPVIPPTALASRILSGTQLGFTWVELADDLTAVEWQLSTSADFSTILRSGTIAPNHKAVYPDSLAAGTYYFRARTIGPNGVASPYVSAPPITLGGETGVHKLIGVPIGTAGSWDNAGNTIDNAFDGYTSTFFDAPVGQAAVGLDLGDADVITSVRYFPRAGLAYRMVDGLFQGSNDNNAWTDLAKVSATPAEGTFSELPITNPTPFRYVRFLSAPWGFGNVAELEFYGTDSAQQPNTPSAPANLAGKIQDRASLTYTWTDTSASKTAFEWQLSTTATFANTFRSGTTGINVQGLPGVTISALPNNTYYFRARAVAAGGASDWVVAPAPLTLTISDAGAQKLSGAGVTYFGTAGSWDDSGNDYTKAFDGDTATFFDAPAGVASAGIRFTGYEPVRFTSVRFYPRAGLASRMVDGYVEASTDGNAWKTLATITSQPAEGQYTTLPITDAGHYRYIRYVSPSWGYGNVAELEFYGVSDGVEIPEVVKVTGTPIGTPGSWNNTGNDFTNAFDNDASTFFDAPIPQAYVGLQTTGNFYYVSAVTVTPRAGREDRMVGGQFQTSRDGVHWNTFFTIDSAPPTGTTTYDLVALGKISSGAFSYVRYLSPDGGYGNIAELSFYAQPSYVIV